MKLSGGSTLHKNQVVIYNEDFYVVKGKPFTILNSVMVAIQSKEKSITVNVSSLELSNMYVT